MKINTDKNKIDEILDRGTIVQILPTKKEFRAKLLSGDRLSFYIGFDATAPTLHLSHAKNFILLEKFRKLGHEVVVLFGDFTARIGDPTGESAARKQLTREDVKENVKKWKNLIKPLMNFDDENNPPLIKYNHDWLSKLTFEDVINLAGKFTVQQMLERDMFEKRLKEGKPIHLHEFLYPLMQGYDSVAMDIDVELCGTDQIFNALAGRTLLKKMSNKEKFVVAVTLMENPKTGELMSKSKGIGVFLDVSADDMYGQVMAQPDEMMDILFVNLTNLPLNEIKKLVTSNNKRDVKMRLAFEIVKIFSGEDIARKAEENFVQTFQKKETPDDMELFTASTDQSIVDILVASGLSKSKSDAQRTVVQGGVRLDGEKVLEEKANAPLGAFEGERILQKGKRYFLRLTTAR
ncbi:MAG: tyrosine--tRNA ligase [Clostridia bacterium]|nr:tyrosine--tRNA ligase [Clostridia bacterium]